MPELTSQLTAAFQRKLQACCWLPGMTHTSVNGLASNPISGPVADVVKLLPHSLAH